MSSDNQIQTLRYVGHLRPGLIYAGLNGRQPPATGGHFTLSQR